MTSINDKSAVPCLVEALEQNQVVYSGGTETQMLQQELNDTLVATLGKLTGLNLRSKTSPSSNREIRQIIQRTKKWWSENRRR